MKTSITLFILLSFLIGVLLGIIINKIINIAWDNYSAHPLGEDLK
jgi:hypothetical protein